MPIFAKIIKQIHLPVKKIIVLAMMLLVAAACNNKKSADGKDGADKADTTNISEKDTAALEIDSDKPIKKVYEIEGVPEGQKIVYVNLDSLQEKYQYFVDENERIKAKLSTLEKEMAGREKKIIDAQKALQVRFQELQSKAQTLTGNELKAAEVELQNKEMDILKMQENYHKYKETKEQELLKSQENTNKKIRERIDAYLAKVAEENGWDFILSYSDITNPVLFGNKKLDITTQILVGLNEDYKSIKK